MRRDLRDLCDQTILVLLLAALIVLLLFVQTDPAALRDHFAGATPSAWATVGPVGATP